MRKIFYLLIFLISLNFPITADSLIMSSTNFNIITDTVSVGGDVSASTNYKVYSTIGEIGSNPAQSTSANYNADLGFQALTGIQNLSVTLSTASISLGTLSLTSVASASQTITVSTDSSSGYTTTIEEDGNLRSGANTIPDVSGGAITAGTAAYGFTTSTPSGSPGLVNAITSTASVIFSSSTAVSAEQTVATYKAAVGSGTAYGNYSHAVTFTTTINY